MSHKILLWNTQHLNHQTKAESLAYQQKMALLHKLALSKVPDIIALFEVGTTGKINETAIAAMDGYGYKLVTMLDKEGGIKALTTLGCLVFVSNARVNDFAMLPWNYVLGDGERRAPVVIVHKATGHAFAFYHANASYNAQPNMKAAIEFLVQHRGSSFSELVFFGGDLNFQVDQQDSVNIKDHKPLQPSFPSVAGTHIQIVSKTGKDISEAYRLEVENMGGLEKPLSLFSQEYRWGEGILEDTYVAQPRILDYAYVTSTYKWFPQCEGNVELTGSKDGGYAKIRRMYQGDEVRSDHFPVFYLGQGKDERLGFVISLDEQAPPFAGALSAEFYFGKFRSNPRERDKDDIEARWVGSAGAFLYFECEVNLYTRYLYARSTGAVWPLIVVLGNPNPGEFTDSTRYFHVKSVGYR